MAALELCCASQACLDGGLLALGFLPRLTSLSVSLDIHPASPAALSELPAGLASLKLGSMWLEGLSEQLGELTGGLGGGLRGGLGGELGGGLCWV